MLLPSLMFVAMTWVAIGLLVAWWTWNPEQDGLVWTVLLWPLQLASRWVGK